MHPTDDTLELYALGRLDEPDATALEEHLLLCEACRDRLADWDEYLASLLPALRELRASRN